MIMQATLTEKELNILSRTAKGYANKEIAAEFNYSENTIARNMNTIYKKLGVQNKTHAVLKGIKLGLININDALGLDYMEFTYATAHDRCDKCGKKYIEHPLDMTVLGYEDMPFLHVDCQGRRLKL